MNKKEAMNDSDTRKPHSFIKIKPEFNDVGFKGNEVGVKLKCPDCGSDSLMMHLVKNDVLKESAGNMEFSAWCPSCGNENKLNISCRWERIIMNWLKPFTPSTNQTK